MANKERRSNAKEYSVLVLELDDAKPRRISSHPNLVVDKTYDPPKKRFDDLLQGKGKKKWYANRIVKLREDLMPESTFTTGEKANDEMGKLKKSLKEQGFTVGQDQKIWQVYVIELAKEGGPEKWVYVGVTSKTVEERFREHKDGRRNKKGRLYNKEVKEHGDRLLYDLFPDENIFFTQDMGEAAEKLHAEKLESEGFTVVWG